MFNRSLFLLLICMQGSLSAMDLALFNDIKTMFALYGNDQYMINEEIIQRSHVLQAALIADVAGAPEDVIVALLLHDIGQIVSKEHVGDVLYLHANHDEAGAMWLRDHGFPSFVADLVRYHTIAKVVLCMENPQYFDALSVASKESYFIQKDKYFNESGQKTLGSFLAHPRAQDMRRARKCDDMAKIIGLNEQGDRETPSLPSFDAYYDMVLRVCNGTGLSASASNWMENIDHFHQRMTDNREEFETMIKNTLNCRR